MEASIEFQDVLRQSPSSPRGDLLFTAAARPLRRQFVDVAHTHACFLGRDRSSHPTARRRLVYKAGAPRGVQVRSAQRADARRAVRKVGQADSSAAR